MSSFLLGILTLLSPPPCGDRGHDARAKLRQEAENKMVMSILFEMKSEGLDKRTFKKVSKELYIRALDRYRKKWLPEHFKPGASGKYGYAPRTPKYNQRKQRKFGHQIPLVFRGKTKRLVPRNAKITATSTRGGRMRSRSDFSAFSGRSRSGGAQATTLLRTIREIETITPGEQKDLARFAKNAFPQLARQKRFQRKKRRKSKG